KSTSFCQKKSFLFSRRRSSNCQLLCLNQNLSFLPTPTKTELYRRIVYFVITFPTRAIRAAFRTIKYFFRVPHFHVAPSIVMLVGNLQLQVFPQIALVPCSNVPVLFDLVFYIHVLPTVCKWRLAESFSERI